MSEKPVLYRKRLIPSECIRLDNDEILLRSDSLLVTRWKTIRPKKELSCGSSCYLLDKGWKVSRFLNHSGELICWYCDIIDYTWDAQTDTYVFIDLLAFKPNTYNTPFVFFQALTQSIKTIINFFARFEIRKRERKCLLRLNPRALHIWQFQCLAPECPNRIHNAWHCTSHVISLKHDSPPSRFNQVLQMPTHILPPAGWEMTTIRLSHR